VEPRGRGPGHRPRVPDRPEAPGPGPQARVPRDARGEDRRHDRGQEIARGTRGGDGRGLAHRAVHGRAARALRAPARGGGGGGPFDGEEGSPPSRPREAKGGIKAQTRRGAFAESWWARRWLAVLEGFSIGTRLHRGRAYARRGQVLGIAITEGRVEAQVQGSREKPYDVVLQVKTLGAGDWDKLGGVLAREARFAARLLAGAMPDDGEDAFRRAGLSLFPERRQDLRTSCSCPDWSNPCKHIAAVYYLLGEEFDRDPFLIFRLRGRERAALLAALGEAVPAS